MKSIPIACHDPAVLYSLSFTGLFVFPQPISSATTTVTFLTNSLILWFSAKEVKLKNSTKCVNSRISTYPFFVSTQSSQRDTSLETYPHSTPSRPHTPVREVSPDPSRGSSAYRKYTPSAARHSGQSSPTPLGGSHREAGRARI